MSLPKITSFRVHTQIGSSGTYLDVPQNIQKDVKKVTFWDVKQYLIRYKLRDFELGSVTPNSKPWIYKRSENSNGPVVAVPVFEYDYVYKYLDNNDMVSVKWDGLEILNDSRMSCMQCKKSIRC